MFERGVFHDRNTQIFCGKAKGSAGGAFKGSRGKAHYRIRKSIQRTGGDGAGGHQPQFLL